MPSTAWLRNSGEWVVLPADEREYLVTHLIESTLVVIDDALILAKYAEEYPTGYNTIRPST